MADIKYLKDDEGNIFYPVTHADAILGEVQSSGPEFKFWFGTEAEYLALETKDDDTIYLIKEG